MPPRLKSDARKRKEFVTPATPHLAISRVLWIAGLTAQEERAMQPEMLLAFAALILIILSFAVWRLLKRTSPLDKELRKLIKRISTAHLSDFLIPDGMGGEIHIAHLLLTQRGFLLLDPREVGGMVFAGEKMQEWSASSQGQRMTFENPIPALYDRIAAVRALIGSTPIQGNVVFSSQTSFPKGHPDIVVTPQNLLDTYDAEAGSSTVYGDQWSRITDVAKAA